MEQLDRVLFIYLIWLLVLLGLHVFNVLGLCFLVWACVKTYIPGVSFVRTSLVYHRPLWSCDPVIYRCVFPSVFWIVFCVYLLIPGFSFVYSFFVHWDLLHCELEFCWTLKAKAHGLWILACCYIAQTHAVMYCLQILNTSLKKNKWTSWY